MSKRLGNIGEKIALNYLLSKSYLEIEKNWYCKYSEIDLVMKKKNVTIFVEVKMASKNSFSLPERMFTPSKIKKLLKAISLYTVKHRIKDYRLDLVAISYAKNKGKLNHYKDVLSFL